MIALFFILNINFLVFEFQVKAIVIVSNIVEKTLLNNVQVGLFKLASLVAIGLKRLS